MKTHRSPIVAAWLPALATVAIVCPSGDGRTTRLPPCASLELANHTDRPIFVYLDGRFVARCDAAQTQVIRCNRFGTVSGVGRFRCEQWGPRPIDLVSGATTRWAFEASPSKPRRGGGAETVVKREARGCDAATLR
jgi:hypothetical protein